MPKAANLHTLSSARSSALSCTPYRTGHADITSTSNGSPQALQLAYECFGNPAHPSLLLIMGLGTQLVAWPSAFIEKLVAGGLHVIRYDNRDIGLSTKIRTRNAPRLPLVFARAKLGLSIQAPYTLDDMANDAAQLLTALDIEQAHIMGASMGGMIAQLVAADHPEKTLSLISVMSTTGRRRLPLPERRALLRFFEKPKNQDEDTLVDFYIQTKRIIGSPGYPQSLEKMRNDILLGIRRSYYPAGTVQQLTATMASPQRANKLGSVSAPALVIHGDADPLVRLAHGKDTAKHLPNAKLDVIPGMGHDLPPLLFERIANSIITHVNQT